MPDATVVIATHNRASQLRDCLASLARQSVRERFDVVVVDNASEDATAATIQAAAGVRGVFVAEPNRAKARNAGIAVAAGATIVFCDDDTIAPEGFVAAHLTAHERTPNAVVSGPIINVADETLRPMPRSSNYSQAFFCTCNVSVARADLLAAGGFDEHYDLYGWEDTDLGVRLREKGLRRIFDWAAYIYHVKPAASMTLERRRAQAREKGMMAARFVRKNPSLPVRLATGAYAFNFARAALVRASGLPALFERMAQRNPPDSLSGRVANEALVDAAYVDALRDALRASRG